MHFRAWPIEFGPVSVNTAGHRPAASEIESVIFARAQDRFLRAQKMGNFAGISGTNPDKPFQVISGRPGSGSVLPDDLRLRTRCPGPHSHCDWASEQTEPVAGFWAGGAGRVRDEASPAPRAARRALRMA